MICENLKYMNHMTIINKPVLEMAGRCMALSLGLQSELCLSIYVLGRFDMTNAHGR